MSTPGNEARGVLEGGWRNPGVWAAVSLGVFLVLLPWESGVRLARVSALGVFFLSTALLIWREREPAHHVTRWIAPVSAVFLAILLSCFFSMDSGFSFKTLIRQHLWFLLTFLAVGAWAVTPQRQWWMVRCIVLSGMVSAVAGIFFFYFAEALQDGGWIRRAHRYIYTAMDEDGVLYHRAQGTMHSYTRSAMIFMVTIPAAAGWLAVAMRQRRYLEMVIVAIILIVSSYYLGLTKARGAWVGAGVGGFAAFLLAGGRGKIALGVLGVLLLTVLTIQPVRDRAGTFVMHLSKPDLLFSGRLDLWGQGMRPIRENLWFGIGYGGDIFLQEVVMADYELITDRRQPDLHQLYLQTLAEMGLIGLLAYGWFIGAVIWTVAGHLRGRPDPVQWPGVAVSTAVLGAFLLLGSIYYFNEEQVAHLLFATLGLVVGSSMARSG